MMGESNPQPRFYYNISLESFVPVDHPLRRVRPLIDHAAIRRECRPLYSDRGRPSIPPEQLFLALIGGYLLGVTSERRLVMELHSQRARIVLACAAGRAPRVRSPPRPARRCWTRSSSGRSTSLCGS